ncbi:Txe/YoeB family addiction module toxin [Eubacterium barkeri]|uniref:Endoribonuclease YoeB n=1 Tax=Eubacterium barkeri TaxID=1528 RepID=A0A1H3HIT0_EUBBA|nr:Txe/YoeB family addiction module toxin [Eubacterium barkeri]SDY15456.1 toxin YoeB [Eubacterium barkeri]
MSKLTFSEMAWADYLTWQNEDKKTLKRINQLIKDIERQGPLTGIGKPERLKGNRHSEYSRRINSFDRLVYEIEEDVIIIKQCKGHYND